MKLKLANLEPGRWALRRLVQFVLAFAASIALIVVQYGSDQFVPAVQITLAFLLTYAGPPLYVPLSLSVWVSASLSRRPRWRGGFDSLFFLVHGYGAMCVMYNGFGSLIDPDNSMVLLWLCAAAVHGVLLLKEGVATRRLIP